MEKLVIDPEFRAAIPTLSEEELSQLRENILAEGIRDPLVLWAEHNTILDGHNRYDIACDYALSFQTAEVQLPDRDAAMLWIIRNQLGRRNLHPDAASLLRGRMYNMQKQGHGGQIPASRDQSDPTIRTADRLASEFGVSAPTIKRDGKFAEAVDALAAFVPDISAQAMAGDLPSRKDVIEAAKDPQKFYETHQLISQSNSNEWYTPAEYVEAARRVMGSIDTDPATNPTAQLWIKAGTHYTQDNDGLQHAWYGNVWMNPPWGQLTGKFVGHLADELAMGRIAQAIVLVNAHATDTSWFTPLWEGLLCFTDHRIDYKSPEETKSTSTHGSVFVYFGPNKATFCREFARWGTIVERVTYDD